MLRNIWELRALHCIGRLRNWDYKLRSNMKQYSLVVILHICLLAILSVGVYVLYCADLWFSYAYNIPVSSGDRNTPLLYTDEAIADDASPDGQFAL